MRDSIGVYKEGIKAHYHQVKGEHYNHFLLHPTAAKLRELAIVIMRDSNNPIDKKIFHDFLGFGYEVGCINAIKKETDRFKPLATFLKNRTELADLKAIEMLALILELPSRPLKTFVSDEGSDNKRGQGELSGNRSTTTVREGEKISLFRALGKKHFYLIAGLIGIAIFGFYLAMPLNAYNKCMQWQTDHYALLDCKIDSLTDGSTIEPYDKKKAALRLIPVDSNTVCFKDEKPQLWYIKSEGEVYFFNQPGQHPVLGKVLRPISRYICEKYILGENTN